MKTARKGNNREQILITVIDSKNINVVQFVLFVKKIIMFKNKMSKTDTKFDHVWSMIFIMLTHRTVNDWY